MNAPAAQLDTLWSWVDRAAELARREPFVDAFEVRADESRNRVVALHDGKLANATLSRGGGLGLHVYAGAAAAYVHLVELDERRLREALARGARLASANARRAWRGDAPAMRAAPSAHERRLAADDPTEASNESVLDLLRRAEDAAKAANPAARVATALGALSRRVVYLDSAGAKMERETLVSTLRVTAALRDGGRVGDGMSREAGDRGLADYAEADLPERLGREAVGRAKESLEAVSFPSGRYRVLCDGHLSGMLAHESFGHLAEHDLVASGWSTLAGRLGSQLAVPEVTIADAPVAPHDARQGVRVVHDDQGVRGRTVMMLERGVLREWMHTRESAAATGVEATGNGRALDSRFPSIVRMRNTYFEPGEHTVDEALEALGDGIYLLGARGGAPYSDGSFMFTSIRGFLVEKGEIVRPVRSTSIHGNVLDFLRNVELLTSDFEVQTNYFGGCGKRDQSFLHVGVGGPHVLVRDALLGGQGA